MLLKIGIVLQCEPLNRASVYRANRLFEQFRLKKNDPIFFLINSSLIRTGTPPHKWSKTIKNRPVRLFWRGARV